MPGGTITPDGAGWPAIPGPTSGSLISFGGGGGGGGNLEIPGGNTSGCKLGTMEGPDREEGCCLIGGGGGGGRAILVRSFTSGVLESASTDIPSN